MRALPALPQLQRECRDPCGGARDDLGVGTDGPGDARGVTRASAGRWAAALGITLATTATMIATGPRLAIVWDEGYTLGREERLREWCRALADPPRFAAGWRPPALELVQRTVGEVPPRPDQLDSRAELLTDPAVLDWFWPFAREEPH